ncbi:hypothetical protein [Limosilactobacillus fastidiosus]|uniref:Uncharacterized protein n=1 Tax=Limosilactobacillus fastidiosus TaxID=2759855 RepID=A0ABR6E8Y0_9LACO|nr:hypothetical protein [Limosilactobacillus fastidiosus]MBB1063650.1 hypothetical protein [Limosilactobacillus fastidiosus]MCD7084225.1 hypothetical protein [Limosilactobacillus fastidiosus]
MDLQKITAGMDLGVEAIEHNFEAVDQTVENMGGGKLSQLHWSDVTTEGLVATNDWGLLPASRNSGYQTAQLGNKKLVWFHPILQRLNSNFNGSSCGFVIKVPHNIEPQAYAFGGSIDPDRQWGYMMGQGFALSTYTGIVKDDNWVKDNLYSFSVFYLANN